MWYLADGSEEKEISGTVKKKAGNLQDREESGHAGRWAERIKCTSRRVTEYSRVDGPVPAGDHSNLVTEIHAPQVRPDCAGNVQAIMGEL